MGISQSRPFAGRPAVVGAVAIGRNEGERLRVCLQSLLPVVDAVVYVDSGSTDGSAALARGLGATVVDLDMSTPFTAARARNAGTAQLRQVLPDVEFIQFVDGDCELRPTWIAVALEHLRAKPELCAVYGRVRERFPERSVYNQIADIDWGDRPDGETRFFGGNAMLRDVALRQAGGYRDSLIAGEEPELSVRMRGKGWKILRVRDEMVLHDVAMYRFSQFWKRTRRTGYAYTEGAALHGHLPEKHFVREFRRLVLWGGVMPTIALLGAVLVSPWLLSLLLVYPVQIVRAALSNHSSVRWRRAVLLVTGKLAEFLGAVDYWRDRRSGRAARLIEYK